MKPLGKITKEFNCHTFVAYTLPDLARGHPRWRSSEGLETEIKPRKMDILLLRGIKHIWTTKNTYPIPDWIPSKIPGSRLPLKQQIHNFGVFFHPALWCTEQLSNVDRAYSSGLGWFISWYYFWTMHTCQSNYYNATYMGLCLKTFWKFCWVEKTAGGALRGFKRVYNVSGALMVLGTIQV